MANLNGGYVMINLADTSNLYNLALKAIDANKPIMVYGDDIPYIADSVTADGSSVTITKGGQIITISDANVITKTGDKDGALMSSIVDNDGNARFIEGDGVGEEISGLNISYNKYSLSGSHLMFVLAGTIDDTTVIANLATLTTFTLPSYIFNKIYPVWATNFVDQKTFPATANDWTTQDLKVVLHRGVNNEIKIIKVNDLTLTANRGFRIQFDLLIDTE